MSITQWNEGHLSPEVMEELVHDQVRQLFKAVLALQTPLIPRVPLPRIPLIPIDPNHLLYVGSSDGKLKPMILARFQRDPQAEYTVSGTADPNLYRCCQSRRRENHTESWTFLMMVVDGVEYASLIEPSNLGIGQIQELCERCGYQPARIRRLVQGLQRAILWFERRRAGMERHAQEILRQQQHDIAYLESLHALRHLKEH